MGCPVIVSPVVIVGTAMLMSTGLFEGIAMFVMMIVVDMLNAGWRCQRGRQEPDNDVRTPTSHVAAII